MKSYPIFAALAASVLMASASAAQFQIDRSVMDEKYWRIWNEKEQARIDADIEANRKADMTVEVGAPDGTEVRYEQISHEFRFGASTFNFGQLGSSERNRREAYWNALPREKAVKEKFWRRPPPGPIIDYLKSRGLRAHGHILVTGGFRPEWLYDKFCPDEEKRFLEGFGLHRHEDYNGTWYQWEMQMFRTVCKDKLYPKLSEQEIGAALPVWTSEMRRLWRKRILDIGAQFGKLVDSWDVVNESARDFARYGKSRTGLPVWKSFKGIMPGDFPLLALRDAKEAFPETTELVINENKIGEEFLRQVNDLTKEGVRIDLIGCQMHIMDPNLMKRLAAGSSNVNWVGTPATIRRRLDTMARTGRRIHISEVTIPQSEKGARGLAVQATAVRNLYRIWFSHKAVAGITWWNLVDGCSFPGEPQISGLFTYDLRKKPAYEVLESLINGEWCTKGVSTAKDGKVAFRGFRGRYRLTWKCADGKEQTKEVDVK